MLQISVYPCRMCLLLQYVSWLSTSADLSKFLKSLSLSWLISPPALSMSGDGKRGSKVIAAETSWDFLQKNLWSWRKCHWKGLLPTVMCGTFQKWGSEGTCLWEPGWVCISLTPCNWRAGAIFACLCHTENIQGEDLFPMSDTYHITCTQ